ncbi:MAG: secretin N-terminal domain-containing protein [Phycisphaerae bacterium]|nr:secretin N-terminal domain-containing protein [Phycisphaerae bacterium]MDD5381518.1 secretin N-terminal domain-containing protein [Phycisphaerae bacterium]
MPFQCCEKALVRAKCHAVARRVFIFICAVTVILSGSYLFAAEQGAASGVERYRVFSLKYISAEQGKKYLAEAGVGTVSQLPGANVLLVTAPSEDLIKASAILGLVDANGLFEIKVYTAVGPSQFPPNEQIATEVNDISIGTFVSPPSSTAKAKAIIDVHDNNVIIVAEPRQLERIISAIGRLLSSGGLFPQAVEPDKSAELVKAGGAETKTDTEAELKRAEDELKRIAASPEPVAQEAMDVNEPNELLDKLLNSLAETEKIAAEEHARQTSQPAAVAPAPAEQAAAGVPDANLSSVPSSVVAAKKESIAKTDEPNDPFADLEQTEEASPQITEEPQSAEPNLTVEEPESEPALEKVRSYEPAPIANGNEMLELDLPAKLNIIDLVDLVGKYLQLDYMYDETQVRGEVSLKLQGPIKVKDLYPLLESVLRFRGFVMARKGNLVTIVPAADALGIDPALQPEAGEVQLGDIVITHVFKLKYIDTSSAQNLLTSMKLGANISPIPETGTLIVTEYAYRMARVEELLDMVDQPGAPKQFRFRQLKYTMAATLAPKIKTLAEQLGTISITVAAPVAAQPPSRRIRAGRPAPAPAAPAALAQTTVYLDADERTNRVLMIGLEEQLVVVESLIDSLDVEQQDLRTMRLYDIQYVGADEVVKKLGELGIIGDKTAEGKKITVGRSPAPGAAPAAAPAATSEVEPLVEQPQVVIIESTNSLLVNATPEQHVQIATIISYVDSETLRQAIPYVIYALENQAPEDLAEVLQKFIQETIKDKEGKIQQTIKKTEEDIIIVPDENTFSILVYASKKNQEWIGSLIKQLDKRRPQVLLDAMLVEITESDSFDYDLQLVSKFPEMLPGGIMQKLATGTSALSPFPSNRVGEATSILGEASPAQGFYAGRHIQMLLELMQSKGYGRVLARPKILVNDNEKGHIDTTNTIYVSRQAQTQPNEGVVQTSYTFDQFPSGINLDITPHISEGDLLRLEIKMQRSSQIAPEGGIGQNDPPPDKSENNVETIVTVPDDSTIILGGITTIGQTKDNWKVPFLGDIPIAGGLFRRISTSSSQTKLYVFVRANILRPSETAAGLPDLERISDRNRGAVEDFEERFQRHQDWPGIEPEPIDPLHILESD